MKIRQGFVSNSSSSSFCILGQSFDTHELYEKFNIDEDDYEFESDAEEALENIIDKLGFCMETDYENDCCYIGIGAESLDENKTIKQQKEEILKKFNDAGFNFRLEDIKFMIETIPC